MLKATRCESLCQLHSMASAVNIGFGLFFCGGGQVINGSEVAEMFDAAFKVSDGGFIKA